MATLQDKTVGDINGITIYVNEYGMYYFYTMSDFYTLEKKSFDTYNAVKAAAEKE